MKWIIAELVGEGNARYWHRRAEEFGAQAQADEWIRRQPEPQRFEAREVEDGVAAGEAP